MVSSAKPKIADYHFTTIIPNLGVVSLDVGNNFVLADIPGLIEGAHSGIGLGHEFLKHVERTKLLLHIIDIGKTEDRDPLNDFEIINNELLKFNPILAKRPQVIAANKMDIPGSEDTLLEFCNVVEKKGYKVFPISAATNKGLKELMFYLSDELKKIPETILIDEAIENVVYSIKEEEPLKIRKENDIFIVEGKWIEKIVSSTNFSNQESLQYFQRIMKKKGVSAELEKMGIQEGDTVKLGDYEFEYIE